MMSEWEFLDDFEDVRPIPRDNIEVQAFIAKCHEDIYDIGPMLIFADWLEEREYYKSARRLRLVAECRLIDYKPYIGLASAVTALYDTFDIELDYRFALDEKWLAHKPQYMDWMPRVIRAPKYLDPFGQRQTSVEYNLLHIEKIIIHRRYYKGSEFFYTYSYTNYGREDGPETVCTVNNSMTYEEFARWLNQRRKKNLIDNSNIVGFFVQMKFLTQGGSGFSSFPFVY
jgi:hypothetical protein